MTPILEAVRRSLLFVLFCSKKYDWGKFTGQEWDEFKKEIGFPGDSADPSRVFLLDFGGGVPNEADPASRLLDCKDKPPCEIADALLSRVRELSGYTALGDDDAWKLLHRMTWNVAAREVWGTRSDLHRAPQTPCDASCARLRESALALSAYVGLSQQALRALTAARTLAVVARSAAQVAKDPSNNLTRTTACVTMLAGHCRDALEALECTRRDDPPETRLGADALSNYLMRHWPKAPYAPKVKRLCHDLVEVGTWDDDPAENGGSGDDATDAWTPNDARITAEKVMHRATEALKGFTQAFCDERRSYMSMDAKAGQDYADAAEARWIELSTHVLRPKPGGQD